jgi:AraC-like DNA-binding protein/mannose-6-phosphate isomerase-like protein (cupin superfamily)
MSNIKKKVALLMLKKVHSYQTRQEMLNKNYEIFHYSDTVLKHVSLHHHDFYEFYFFISGDVIYLSEGKSYTLKPGDIILINSTVLHQPIINSNKITYERIVLWIDKAYLNSLSSEATNLTACFENTEKDIVLRLNPEMQQNILAILKKLLSMESYKGVGSDLLSNAYIMELLVNVNSIKIQNDIKLDIEIKKNNLIDQIIEYINDHTDEEISINEISEQFYLSKFHLLREFKKYSGTTMHKYIVQKKLIRSKELILKGMPILNVYKQCGFGDYSNFFRAFKNEYGVTPKSFLEIMLQKKQG